MVIDATEIDQSWSPSTLPQRYSMSILDEITREKQRVSEALTRVDAQREKLSGQLSELEAAERVLGRYGKRTQTKKTASPRTATTVTKATASERGRRRAATMTTIAAGG